MWAHYKGQPDSDFDSSLQLNHVKWQWIPPYPTARKVLLAHTPSKNSDSEYLFLPFFLVVIIGSANAINLSDGLDGLASGLAMIALTPFILISLINGNYELTLFLVTVVGALLGFLIFNFHPARIFIGDCGSLSLGALLGISSIVLDSEIILVIAGILFVMEAFSVILQVAYYKITHKRIFLMAPLHHHFEKKGWQEWKVVMMFYLIGCFASLMAIIIEVI